MIATVMMIVALVKPKWGTFGKKPEWNRKKAAGLWLAACIVLSGLASATTPPEVKQAQQQKAAQQKMEEEAKKHVFAKYYGFTMEQTKALDEALASVGLGKIKDSTKQGEHDYTLDVEAANHDYDPAKDVVHVFFDQDNKLLSVKLRTIPLWDNGKVVHQVSDYILSIPERSEAEEMSKTMVKTVLKAPSTAKFDDKTFKYFKVNGEITMIGTVDAQNGFGAMIRSPFKTQFKMVNGKMKPTGFIFDGNEIL
ncbi:hypothetical protein [Acidaminococcus sp.]|uniref:hypothetical protein n=1 Tax=Acidaminococcus sp. TaxID=1872103 RepID=UPI0035209FB4